jgi:hypothetical protein
MSRIPRSVSACRLSAISTRTCPGSGQRGGASAKWVHAHPDPRNVGARCVLGAARMGTKERAPPRWEQRGRPSNCGYRCQQCCGRPWCRASSSASSACASAMRLLIAESARSRGEASRPRRGEALFRSSMAGTRRRAAPCLSKSSTSECRSRIALPRSFGAEGAAGGRFAQAPSAPGVSAPPLASSFDADATARYRAAADSTRNCAATFDTGPSLPLP